MIALALALQIVLIVIFVVAFGIETIEAFVGFIAVCGVYNRFGGIEIHGFSDKLLVVLAFFL